MATTRTRMWLHMGAVVIPYANEDHARGIRSVTTYDVMRWLEGRPGNPDRYALISTYYRVHFNDIHRGIMQGVTRSVRTLLMGGPHTDPFHGAMRATEAGFRQFISSQEAERVGIPGTPTLAALMGVSHRYKNPRRRSSSAVIRRVGQRRPSFRDTGLLMRSYRAWISGLPV